MQAWFCYCPHDGFCLFDTEAEAKAYAEESVDMQREYASRHRGWADDAESVCWGRVVQQMQITHRTTSGDGSEEIVDMGLVPVSVEVR